MASWNWELCRADGVALAPLDRATGRKLTFVRNSYAEAGCSILHSDPVARKLFDYLTNGGIPTLKAWRRAEGASASVLRFRGWWAPMQEQLEEAATIALVFRSPFFRLLGDGNNRGRFSDAVLNCTGEDAGAIAQALRFLYAGDGSGTDPVFGVTATEDSYVGLAEGDTEATQARDRTYQNVNVGQAIVNLSQVIGGFDFSERFVDDGSTMALLDIEAMQGEDRPGVRFEYGPGTLANCKAVTRTTDYPQNSIKLFGDGDLNAVQEDADSIARYGRWRYQATQSGVVLQDSLNEAALALIRPKPIKTLSFTPMLELPNCPKPWDDFWLGDTAYFYGRRDSFEEASPMRLNKITVVIDENGLERAELPDPLNPDGEALTQASLSAEVTQ